MAATATAISPAVVGGVGVSVVAGDAHTAEVLECHDHATTGPWNYALSLGILPFSNEQYESLYSHPSWTLLETIALLDWAVTHGPMKWSLIANDPILSVRHTVQECETRFLHMLALSATFCHAVGGPGIPLPITNDTPIMMPPSSSMMAPQQPMIQQSVIPSTPVTPATGRTQRTRTPSTRHPQLAMQQQQQPQPQQYGHYPTQPLQSSAHATAAAAIARAAAMDDDGSDVITGPSSMAAQRGGYAASMNRGGRGRRSGIGKRGNKRHNSDYSDEDVSDGDGSDDGAPSAHHRAAAMASAGTRSSARLSTATRRSYVLKDEDDSFSDQDDDDGDRRATPTPSASGSAAAGTNNGGGAAAIAAAAMRSVAGGVKPVNNLPPNASPPIEYTGEYDEDDNPIPVAPVGKKIEKILALRDRRLTASQLAAEQANPPDARHIQKRRLAISPSPVSSAVPSSTSSAAPVFAHDNEQLREAVANSTNGTHDTLKLEPIKLEMDHMAISPPLSLPSLGLDSMSSGIKKETDDIHIPDDTPISMDESKDGGVTLASIQPAITAPVASPTTANAIHVKTDDKKIGDIIVREYLIKLEGESYLHCEWISMETMRQRWGVRPANDKVKRFMLKWDEIEAKNNDQFGGEPFDPRFIEVERVIAVREAEVNITDMSPEQRELYKYNEMKEVKDSTGDDPNVSSSAPAPPKPAPTPGTIKVEYFTVKWTGLSYSQCTEELASDINDEMKIAQFRRFNRPPGIPGKPAYSQEFLAARIDNWYTESAVYKNKNQLRDYQIQGVNWLIAGWHRNRNLILADEMGLGKTVQCVAFLEHLRKVELNRGPFLIVVPLSTLTHWKREVELWTDMNGILYHDPVKGKDTRRYMREHEFWYASDPARKMVKFNILITSYEVFLADLMDLIDIRWKYVIIDEGHRIKNKSAKLLEALKQLKCNRRLLMSGTPIQNNTSELWTLMNFLQPDEFSSQRDFADRFGSLERNQQVSELQAMLKPYMLRRMKESAEKSIPPKDETIVDIELTTLQKQYYRAIYDKNLKFLRIGVNTQNAPRLVNIEMELRKCCNHPWLITGAEEKEVPEGCTEHEYYEKTIQASGKMVFLHKLLPKLKRDGHKVLIFSQMKKVLDVLQGYMKHFGYLHERLDGGVTGNEREAAIDRFNRKELNRFVFLLSTRAGGVGLNLATADVVIIFDSDWNPQQDVQAQARAHRIGQKNSVQVYRLVTIKTYESEMFDRASKKLGLDHAVLTKLESGGGEAVENDHDVDEMLRLGAYGLVGDDEAEANRFCEADIDTILASRTRTLRVIKKGDGKSEVNIEAKTKVEGKEPAKGGYTKMKFQSDQADSKIDVTDPEFWTKFGGSSDARTSPDFLLAQLTDGSATKNDTTKTAFFRALEDTNKRIQAQRRNGEDPPDMDDFINLLIQFSAMSTFNDEWRDRADIWLAEAEKRGERKARQFTAATTAQPRPSSSNAPSNTRGGRQQSMKASTGATLSDLSSSSSSSSSSEEEPDSDAPKVPRGRGRPPGSKNKKGLKKKGEDSEFEVDSDDDGDVRGKAKGKTGAKMNVTICDICDIAGALLQCEGDCARAFHLRCLNMDHPPPPTESWVCDECRTGNYACFACGKISSADKDPSEFRRCNVAQCGKFYHVACARKSSMYHFQAGSSNFRCAHHYCVTCKRAGDSKSMVHCQKCPSAFHLRCLQSKGITRLTRKLIYCHECKIKQSATPEGRAAIDKSAQYLTQPLVRKPLPKVKLRKRRGRKLGNSKKPPAPPNAGIYTIRWLVDEEVVWQSYRVPVYCGLDGGGGPPVMDTALANVLQLGNSTDGNGENGTAASGRVAVGKYRLKLGDTSTTPITTIPILSTTVPVVMTSSLVSDSKVELGGSESDTEWCSTCSDESDNDTSRLATVATAALASSSASSSAPTPTPTPTATDDERRGTKRDRDDTTTAANTGTSSGGGSSDDNAKRARTTNSDISTALSISSLASEVTSGAPTTSSSSTTRVRRRHKQYKKGRRARTSVAAATAATVGVANRSQTHDPIKARALWQMLNASTDDQIFQLLEQCGLARGMMVAPVMMMDPSTGQPITVTPPQSVDWCRYCGARAAPTFNTGPWGARKLCRPHWIMWRNRSLDLSAYVNEPVFPLAPTLNTEKRYLLHYMKRADVSSESGLSSSASAPYAPIHTTGPAVPAVPAPATATTATVPSSSIAHAALQQQLATTSVVPPSFPPAPQA